MAGELDPQILTALGFDLGKMVTLKALERQPKAPELTSVLSRQQLRALQRGAKGRFAEIRQVGQRLVIAPRGTPLYLRWADTNELLRPGELLPGTKVTICRDTGKVVRA